MNAVRDSIKQFETISIGEMNAVKLLNRFDSKYQLPVQQLLEILEAIKNDYFVMSVKGEILQTYITTYFDTRNNSFYTEHHNGKLNRLKIRKREYVNSGIGFLEIKKKNNKGKTSKLRFQTENTETGFTLKELEFLNKYLAFEFHLSNYSLPSKNGNRFKRITLVQKDFKERCTIDLNLSFFSEIQKVKVGNLVIIELKQERANMQSPLAKALKDKRIKKQGFSKYCIGRALLEPDLKYNLFKAKLIKLNKQYNGNINYEDLAQKSFSNTNRNNNGTIKRYNNKRTA